LRGIILANIAAGPLTTRPHLTSWFKGVLAFDALLGGHHVPAFWRGILAMNFADPALVSPALVAQWTDLNNRAQGWPHRFGPRPPFSGTPADLAAIRVPALALWSDRDPEVTLARDGAQTLRLLGSARKSLVVVSRCGHMMPVECPQASLAPARRFLDQLESQP
jgi:pimeloyl-ACP methyl ester carboxylesterase